MVGHTHQDFLQAFDSTTTPIYEQSPVDLSEIKEFDNELNLFDISGKQFRKVPLSFLDERIDSLFDWNQFIAPLKGLDCLFLINDRCVENPVMRKFAARLNERYLAKLHHDNINARIVIHKPQTINLSHQVDGSVEKKTS